MKNIKCKMSFCGTAYHGFQSQPHGVTIQDIVQRVLGKILNQPISINGCSRTDAGVHANEYVFSAVYDETASSITADRLLVAANKLLPADIALRTLEQVPLEFHARFNSKGKQYLYRVDNSGEKNVFAPHQIFPYFHTLDIESMQEAAKIIVGTHDFGAFCKAESKTLIKTTVRNVTDITIEKNKTYVDFYISGEGFLHNMVRIIVGSLIYISEGKRSCDDIASALATGRREFAGVTLPPDGLYLNKVFY